MIQYTDDVIRAAYQQSGGNNASAAGVIGNMAGTMLLWTALEKAVTVNAVGISRKDYTGRFLNWITRGKIGAISPLESVTSRMEGWVYAKNPSMGMLLPNAGMREVSRATYSALGDLVKKDAGKLFTKEGARLLVGSAAGVITSAMGVGMVADFASLGLQLGKMFTDQFAHIGRKFMFAPWNMAMSDNVVPVSKQYQAMRAQSIQQLMQSRQLLARGDNTTYNRMLYNNPYDFYNFI